MKQPKLHPSIDRSEIASSITMSRRARVRESEARRSYLEKIGKWLSGESVRVVWVLEQAACAPDGDEGYVVMVPTKEFDQPTTDLPPQTFDLLMQETELMHELGHVLYTDFDRLEAVTYRLSIDTERDRFQDFQNVLEDGAIERQLADEFNCRNDLEIKNANLLQVSSSVLPPKLTLWEAVMVGMMDMAKYDTGQLDHLLDPTERPRFSTDDDREVFEDLLMPLMEEAVSLVVTEPEPTQRVELSFDYFEQITDIIEEHGDFPGLDDDGAAPPDGDQLIQIAQGLSNDPEPAEGADGDPDEIKSDLEEGGTAAVAGGDEEEDDEEGGGDGGGQGQDGPDEEAAVEKFAGRGGDPDGADSGDLVDELESWIEAAGAAAGKDSLQLTAPEPGDEVDGERWQRAQSRADTLERLFNARLQAERASEERANQLAGRLDRRSMMKARRGNPRIFKRESEPEEMDYTCTIVLDRSGSMDRNDIEAAEDAVASVALALEAVGVRVALLSVYEHYPTLEIPFSEPVDKAARKLTWGGAGGGTPLTGAVGSAAELLEGEPGRHFCVVVTDGLPNDEEAFVEAVEGADFPVVTLFIADDVPEFYEGVGSGCEAVKADSGELGGRLRALAQKMYF